MRGGSSAGIETTARYCAILYQIIRSEGGWLGQGEVAIDVEKREGGGAGGGLTGSEPADACGKISSGRMGADVSYGRASLDQTIRTPQ